MWEHVRPEVVAVALLVAVAGLCGVVATDSSQASSSYSDYSNCYKPLDGLDWLSSMNPKVTFKKLRRALNESKSPLVGELLNDDTKPYSLIAPDDAAFDSALNGPDLADIFQSPHAVDAILERNIITTGFVIDPYRIDVQVGRLANATVHVIMEASGGSVNLTFGTFGPYLGNTTEYYATYSDASVDVYSTYNDTGPVYDGNFTSYSEDTPSYNQYGNFSASYYYDYSSPGGATTSGAEAAPPPLYVVVCSGGYVIPVSNLLLPDTEQ